MATLSFVRKNPPTTTHHVPLFTAASDAQGRQGFARIISYSNESGEVRIGAFDDEGMQYGPLHLTIGAGETVHLNSPDLENCNAEKGLDGAPGPGRDHWRLELVSALDIEVLGYLRTDDGFVTSMHDVVPHTGNGHHVAIFNPGRNVNQVSRLRIINRGPEAAEVSIEGIDGSGESPGTTVRFAVPARGGPHGQRTRAGVGRREGRGLPGSRGRARCRHWQVAPGGEVGEVGSAHPGDEPAREPHRTPDQSVHRTGQEGDRGGAMSAAPNRAAELRRSAGLAAVRAGTGYLSSGSSRSGSSLRGLFTRRETAQRAKGPG